MRRAAQDIGAPGQGTGELKICETKELKFERTWFSRCSALWLRGAGAADATGRAPVAAAAVVRCAVYACCCWASSVEKIVWGELGAQEVGKGVERSRRGIMTHACRLSVGSARRTLQRSIPSPKV